ncbi:hypothetical protein [Flaviflexus massiliensis]|uniref:hypothetical protein n=1 Tax=Flaviflexus massiliensis TaxID=1522309 RepID=UPI0006D53401|nr:hypothetical protein [Flaviflexus massiliensis]
MEPLATPQDIRDRWFSRTTKLTLTDEQLRTVIGDVEDVVLQEFPNIREDIDEVTLPARRVTRVVARIAIRFLKNPDGWRQIQATTGSMSQSGTIAGDYPGEIYLTAADRDELTPIIPDNGQGGRGRAFTIMPQGRQPCSTRWV